MEINWEASMPVATQDAQKALPAAHRVRHVSTPALMVRGRGRERRWKSTARRVVWLLVGGVAGAVAVVEEEVEEVEVAGFP